MIEVGNFTGFEISEKEIREIGRSVLKKEGKENLDLNLVFVSSEEIREVNREYRKKDKPTDVLSFEKREDFILPPGQENNLGEVLICPEQVAINAKNFNIDFREEVARVAVHGILHLLGYDHEKDQGEFFKKQKLYIDTLYKHGTTPNH